MQNRRVLLSLCSLPNFGYVTEGNGNGAEEVMRESGCRSSGRGRGAFSTVNANAGRISSLNELDRHNYMILGVDISDIVKM